MPRRKTRPSWSSVACPNSPAPYRSASFPQGATSLVVQSRGIRALSRRAAAFIAVLNVERGQPDQPFLLPAKVKIFASPNRRDQQNDAKKNAERKSDDCSLCSFN